MKRKSLTETVLVLLALMLITCTGFAQVMGNGNVIEQKRKVDEFKGVSIRSGIDLSIQQGSPAGLVIETDENLQEYIISEVREGILKIYIRENTNIRKSTRMVAHVTVSDLRKIGVSGGGDVESVNKISTDELDVNISGGGDLEFELTANRTECNISGGGDASLDGIIKELEASLSGGGDLELDAEVGMLDLDLSGGGDAEIEGGDKASGVSIAISGGGDLDLDIACEKLKTTMSGGGDATIVAGENVTKAYVDITGGGDLSMKLNAVECIISVGGGGDASLTGSAEKFQGEIKSGGELDAAGFKTKIAKLDLTGGSDARIHVDEELSVNASGGSQIYVSGNPHIDSNLTGESKVHSR
jgi:hypothetical protein